ncbi:Uncharacterised protein [Pseudomonas aeruginosa]|nr:Uncharacterised protein [Pseudomonas aeruginosa]
MLSLSGHGAGGSVGNDAAEAGHASEQRNQQRPQRGRLQRSDAQQGQAARQVAPDDPPQPERRPAIAQQPRVDLCHDDEARGIAAEQPAIVLGGNPVELDEHVGRTGDVGEHPGHRHPAGKAIGEKQAVGEQPPVLPQRAGQRRSLAVGRDGFRQPQRHAEAGQGGEQGQADEDRLPALPVQQQAAGHGGEDRRQAHHQHQLGKRLGGADRIAQVTHHCPRDDHPGAAAEGLDEARGDQPLQARRQGAGGRGQGEDTHPHQQRQAPAIAVGHRAVEQLADGQAGEVGGQAQLDVLDVGGEGLGQGREARQVEIDGQWPEGAQGSQYQQDAQVHGSLGTGRVGGRQGTSLRGSRQAGRRRLSLNRL